MKLAMVQDKGGCRLSFVTDSGESVVQTFSGRVEMKRVSKEYAKARGLALHNLKRTGVLVPVETSSKTTNRSSIMERVDSAIARDESWLYAVACESGQILGNVKHMRWFKVAAAEWLKENTNKWSNETIEL